MIFCVKCRRLSPDGQYCTRCLRSWNSRICQGCKVRNDRGALGCTQCSSIDLSEAVTGIAFGWIPLLISGALFVLLVRFVLTHLGLVLGWTEEIACEITAFLTDSTALCVKNRIWDACAFAFILAPLVGQALKTFPSKGGAIGEFLRRLPLTTLSFLWRTAGQLGKLLWGAVIRLFFGKPRPASKVKTDKSH